MLSTPTCRSRCSEPVTEDHGNGHSRAHRSAQDKIQEVVAKLKEMRLPKAAELVEAKAHETLIYFTFQAITGDRSRHPFERIIREIRRA